MITVVGFLTACMVFYAVYLLHNASLFASLKPHTSNKSHFPLVTVIVPARDEEDKIAACLQAISRQTYPKDKFEVLLVNDHSEDATVSIAENIAKSFPGLRILHLGEVQGPAYKKAAVALGISEAKGEIILTTDADCVMGAEWLSSMLAHFEPDTGMVSGPVALTGNKLFQRFQALEFMGLQLVGAGGIADGKPTMCNGANLAYRKEVFEEVGGFAGIDHIASGDDELLMHKIAASGTWKVRFAKSRAAVVQTEALPDVGSFRKQRTRWVSKSTAYQQKGITYTLILSYLAILALPVSAVLSIWEPQLMYWFLANLALKVLSEAVILRQATHFFKRKKLLWILLPEQVLHVIYVLWVGIAGNVRSYEWKGRKVQ